MGEAQVIGLVFQGLRLAAQVGTGFLRREQQINDLEAKILAAREGGEDVTAQMIAEWVTELDNNVEAYQAKLDQLRAIRDGA